MGGASTALLVLLVAVVSAAAAVLVPIHAEDARPFGRASQLSQPDTLVEDGRSLWQAALGLIHCEGLVSEADLWPK